jgi:hypothetical protein
MAVGELLTAELLLPVVELLAERGGCLGVEAVGGVLLVGVALHTAEGVGEHPSVESGVVLGVGSVVRRSYIQPLQMARRIEPPSAKRLAT